MSRRTGIIIAVVATFFFGCAAGTVTAVLIANALQFRMLQSWAPPHGTERPGMGPGPMHLRGQRPMLRHLERQLDLTPEQAARIEEILERSREDYAAIRDSTRAMIERELTPAQRERWDKIETQFRRYRRPDWPMGRGLGD